MKITSPINEELVKGFEYEEALIAAAAHNAYEFSTEYGVASVEDAKDISDGVKFVIPLLIPEGVESGDGRILKEGSLTARDLPVPLMWQPATGSGHDQSYIVGRIDSIDRIEAGLGNARGVFDVSGPYGREAERLVRSGFLRGVSADLDQFEASTEPSTEEDDSNTIKSKKIEFTAARVMGATLVAKPSFGECFITIDNEPSLSEGEEEVLPDGEFSELAYDVEEEIASIIASAAPVVPPKDWFSNPGLRQATPLTVTDDGRVFGHIAAWATSHISMPGKSIRPPRSYSKYAYFRTGVVRTDDGSDVQVGQLTLSGGHAPLQASADQAKKHYDDTNSAFADVVAGEDSYGIWVSGAIRPEVTPSQIRAFRASAPSGDWRPINGRLELVAVCQVNTPGFPIARTITASGGVPGALVAAGAFELAELKESARYSELEARIAAIESEKSQEKSFSIKNEFDSLVEEFSLENKSKTISEFNNLAEYFNS